MKSKKSFFDFIKALLVIALILVAFVVCRAFFEEAEGGGSGGGIGGGNGNVTETETDVETETETEPDAHEHDFTYYFDLGIHICTCGATDLTEHTYAEDFRYGGHSQSCDLCGMRNEDHVYSFTVNPDGTHTGKGCIYCEYDEEEFTEVHEFEHDSEVNQYYCWCGFTVDGINVEWPGVTILGPQDISPYSYNMGDWGILAEDGMVYRHISGAAAANSGANFGAVITNGMNIHGGRYLVFKLRCDVSLDNMSLNRLKIEFRFPCLRTVGLRSFLI